MNKVESRLGGSGASCPGIAHNDMCLRTLAMEPGVRSAFSVQSHLLPILFTCIGWLSVLFGRWQLVRGAQVAP